MPATATAFVPDDRLDLWDLVDTAAAGGPAGAEAFGRLFDATFDQLFGYVFRRTQSREVAQDVTSETFIRALRRIGTLQRGAGSPIAWLYRIAANLIADHYRAAATRLSVATADVRDFAGVIADRTSLAAPAADAGVAERIEATALWEGVQRLTSDKQRDVLIMRFQYGMSSIDVAKVIGRSVAAVKVLQLRGVRALRRDPKLRAALVVLDGRGA